MTITFSYTHSNGQNSSAIYQLTEQSVNVVQSGLFTVSLQSNICEFPFQSLLIVNRTTLGDGKEILQNTIIVTDGQSNNIGTIQFFNVSFLSFKNTKDKIPTSITYPIIGATGIFIPYLNGHVVIDTSQPIRNIFLFQK